MLSVVLIVLACCYELIIAQNLLLTPNLRNPSEHLELSANVPSRLPTSQPSRQPSRQPTGQPSRQPTRQPVGRPSSQPSAQPSRQPTRQPVGRPSSQPTRQPSNQPSGQPIRLPSAQPTHLPSANPSTQPSRIPSTSPSAFPTSAPSCVAGEYGLSGGKCVLCPPGTSGTLGATGSCSLCAIGTYQDQSGQSDCKECPYPWSNVEEGSTECTAIHYRLDDSNYYVLGATSVLWIFMLYTVRGDPYLGAIVLNLLIPSFDAYTNMAYLLSTKFANLTLFVLLFGFAAHPIFTFLLKLYLLKPIPAYWKRFPDRKSVWWLGYERGDDLIPVPTIPSGRLVVFLEFKMHDSLYKLLWEVIVWIIALVLQLVYFVFKLLIFLFYSFFLFCWISVGVIFELTNTLSVGRIWDLWFRVFTESEDFTDESISADTSMMNYGLMNRLLFETLPCTVIQVANNIELETTWTTIAILSVIASGFAFTNVLYRYFFYRCCTREKVSMKDIPIDNSIRIQLSCFGIDKTLIDGKLPNTSHKCIMDRKPVLPLSLEMSSSSKTEKTEKTEKSPTSPDSPYRTGESPAGSDGSNKFEQINPVFNAQSPIHDKEHNNEKTDNILL
jgi:hypothetical protein